MISWYLIPFIYFFSETTSEEDSSYTEESDSDYSDDEHEIEHSGTSHGSLHFYSGSQNTLAPLTQQADGVTLKEHKHPSHPSGHSHSNHEKKKKMNHHGPKDEETKPINIHF